MRMLLLALAVILTAGCSNGHVHFSPGKTYVYRYDLEIETLKDPKLPLARVGIKISSDVWISASNSSVILKFNNTVISDSNGYEARRWMRADQLTAEMASEFEKTIKFEYSNGNVDKISVPSNSSLFTNNIKKAVATALQMTIKPGQYVYYLQEAGSQGTCKTTYLLKTEPGKTLVTKTRNLKECIKPVIKSSGLAYTEACSECLSLKKAISGSDTYKYTLNETANGLVISSIYSEEQILFNPLHDKQSGAIMKAKQWVRFVRTLDSPLHPTPGLYWRDSHEYKFSKEPDTFPFSLDLASTEAQATELLEHLANNNNQSVDPRAPWELAKLVRLLSVGSRDLMERLWSSYSSMANYRRVLRDAIPHEKSVRSLKFIMEKFVHGSLRSSEAAQMLWVSLQTMETDELLALPIVKSLIQHPEVIRDEVVRRVSTLGAGSVIYRWCRKQKSPCPSSPLLQELHDILERALVDSDSETIKLSIRALANAAHPSSLKKIVMLLPGFGNVCGILEPQVIVDAVLSLRRFAKIVPRQVEQIATRLVLSTHLSPELRTAAMIAFFDCIPSLGLVGTVATHLKTDSSVQVRHFAVTLMRSLSMSSIPDRTSLATACRHGLGVLNTVPFPRLRPQDMSTGYSESIYNDKRIRGAAGFVYDLKNHISPIPKSFIFRLETLLAGWRGAPVEIGSRINAVLESALKVTDGSASRQEKMIKIARLISSASPQLLRRLESDVYIAAWDQTLMYWDPFRLAAQYTSKRSTATLISESLSALSTGFSWNGFKGMIPTDVSYKMATSTGFPFTVDAIISGVSSASLKFKGRTSPPWLDNSQVRQQWSNLTVAVDAELSAQIDAAYAVGVGTKEIQAQLKTHARVAVDIPISVEVNADLKKRKYSLKMKDVGEKDIISASIGTMALVENKWSAAPRMRPLIPLSPLEEMSSAEATTGSSESIVFADMPTNVKTPNRIPDMKKNSVTLGELPGGVLMLDYHYRSTSTEPECESCVLSGQYGLSLSIKKVENKIKEVEMTLGLGGEARNISKEFNPIDIMETLEDTNVLMKLRKILAPGLKNHTSSSSSSESYSAESSMNPSSSSSESSESSSSSTSSEQKHQTEGINFVPRQPGVLTEYEAADSSEIVNTKYPKSVGQTLFSWSLETRRENGMKTAWELWLDRNKDEVSVRITYINMSGKISWVMIIDNLPWRDDQAQVIVRWGSEKQYQVNVTLQAGTVGQEAAQRLIVSWKRVPEYFNAIAAMVSKWIYIHSHAWGWHWSPASNPAKRITVYGIKKEDELVAHLETPHWSLLIPVKNPPLSDLISEAYGEFNAAEGSWGNKMVQMVSNTNAAKCSLVEDTVVTFNSRKFKSEMPHICNQVLAQDCTAERKFLVQLKKDLILNENDINVLVADIDVSIHHRGKAVGVTVNGIDIPVSSLPYQHPTGTVSIVQKDQGIALLAARHGLNEVFLDLNGLQINVPDWMRGQTCGLCGSGDGEYIDEFHTPSGRLATSAHSFTQSWVVPGTGCKDISKCYLATKSVKLDRQINLNGQESKCYSVEPVLRCQPGCTPVRTTTVQVGFHCVPAEARVNRAESLSSIFTKSVDVTEQAVAHLACRCSTQCA